MYNKYKKHLISLSAIAVTLMAGGCAEYQLRKLDRMKPEGSEFSRALAREYRNFSVSESCRFADDKNAEHFALKGQMAAAGYGEKVMPEVLTARELPRTALPELRRQRARLISDLNNGGRVKAPLMAAAAQRSFDEWVEQLEERSQIEDIHNSRAAYYKDIERVEDVLFHHHRHGKGLHIYFATGSYKIDRNMYKNLKRAVAMARRYPHSKIILKGHTDASGSHKTNVTLAKNRADAVRAALMAHHIRGGRIIAEGRGIAKHSAMHEGQNRSVTIIIH